MSDIIDLPQLDIVPYTATVYGVIVDCHDGDPEIYGSVPTREEAQAIVAQWRTAAKACGRTLDIDVTAIHPIAMENFLASHTG